MRITRRTFLQAGAATLAGLGVAHAQTDSTDFRGLKVGVHTYTLRKLNFDDAVALTRDLGVSHIGFNPVHVPLDSSETDLLKARAAVAEAGLTLMAAGVVSFGKDEKAALQAFEYAKGLQLPVLVANPTRESLPMVNELVREFDIRIAIHNHGPDSLYSTPEDVLSAIEPFDERVGACADIGHYARSGIAAPSALKALKGRLYDIHLKDVDVPEKRGKSVVLGTGIVDLPGAFTELLEQKFQHHVALEYEQEPNNPGPSVKRCFEYARETLATM